MTRALRSVPAPAGDALDVRIPFVRLDAHDPALLSTLMEAVEDVARRSAFTLGDEVEAFEHDFARFCGAAHAVGVSSGTDAIALALRALAVGPGDEVVVPANSFIATAEAVSMVGATPRLVDVDETSGLLTPSILERNIGPSTRAVIPVHLYGAAVEMEPIVALAEEAGIAVVEDACQAHGARLMTGAAGTLGHCGCFSFYPTKNLGAWGDGGAVVSSDPELVERLRLLRSHGEAPGERHRHRIQGATARLDGLQAAILRVKLRHLESWNDSRRRLAVELRGRLADAPLELPAPSVAGDHVFHLFVVQTDRRDELRAHLETRGIASAIHYPVPIHLTEAYAHLGQGIGSLPVVERRARRICSLPFFPTMTSDEVERLGNAVLELR